MSQRSVLPAMHAASAHDIERVVGLDAGARAAVLDALARALADGVELVHVEPGTDGWRLHHRRDGAPSETRLPDTTLPDALERLVERSGTGARMIALTARIDGERHLVSVRRIDGGNGPSFRLCLHGNAFAPPRLDALGPDAVQLRHLRTLLQRTSGWLAIGAADTFAGERLVRAIAQELAAPDRRLVCLEPPVHPPLAGVLQLVGEHDLVPCDALDTDVVLLAATPTDDTLRALAAEAAERLLVVQRSRARRPSDVLRRLLSIGLRPAWIALACNALLMHHRVRLLCHECRIRLLPEELIGSRRVGAIGAPTEVDVGAWLDRSLQTPFREGPGCAACSGTGHRGSREVIEILDIDANLRAQLLEGNIDAALARIDAPGDLARRLGALAASGDVTDAEAARHLSGRRY